MRIFLVFTVLIFYAFLLNAQEEKKDSVRLHLYDLHKPYHFLYDDFEMDYRLPGNTSGFMGEQGSIKLYSSYMLSTGSGDFNFLSAPHMLSNYHEFYIQNSRINPVTYILGMAQLSAAGYLAYRHIKKYGLK
jgi:hypothetical protein